MANWCECDLTIEGPKHQVEEFLAHAKGEEGLFDFNRFIRYPERFAKLDRAAQEWDALPEPKDGKDRPKDGFNQGGYEWRFDNWGTKWNAARAIINPERTEQWEEPGQQQCRVEVNFETAWSPPKPVIKRASELFPELRFELRYFEGGCQFNGIFVCENGEEDWDECGKYYGTRGG